MGKNNIPLTDVECMVTIDALSTIIQNDEKNDLDRKVAERIRTLIFEVVKTNKMQKSVAEYNKCGDCKYLDESQKKSVGYVCVNTNRVWRSSTAIYHQKCCKACKSFEPKGDSE